MNQIQNSKDILGNGTFSSNKNLEKQFMDDLNFTDGMYDVLLTTNDKFESEEDLIEENPCITSIYEIGQSYRLVHGHISLIVCIAGILMNILIAIVLTRKEMRTPINRMLTALATADILVMVEYIPFSLHMYILDVPEDQHYSYLWAVFVLFHSHFTQILHTINIQLTISMSIWRYMALKSSGKNSTWLTLKRCNLCILAAYICPMIICIPNYLTFSIYHREKTFLQPPFDVIFKTKEIDPTNQINFIQLCEQTNEMLNFVMNCTNIFVERNWYIVELSEMAKTNHGFLHRVNFWIFSVFVKLIPCIVLTFFMVWLINTLYKANRRHGLLKNNNNLSTIPLPTISKVGSIEEEKDDEESKWIEKHYEFSGYNNGKELSQNFLLEGKEAEEHGKSQMICSPTQNLLSPAIDSEALSISSTGIFSNPSYKVNKPKISPTSDPQQNTCLLSSQSKNQEISKQRKKSVGKKHGSDRTSKLLIAVLFLFLVTEIPQGILAFLSGIYGELFFKQCYNPWAEVWDILALINSSINFILYCFMSKQFRIQFSSIFNLGKIFQYKHKI